MQTYSDGMTPDSVIQTACNEQCPNGYHMKIVDQLEWQSIAGAVNAGIDSHLEAITERSNFDSKTGNCLVHPDELHVLLRRLNQDGEYEATLLRRDILTTLEIEEI